MTTQYQYNEYIDTADKILEEISVSYTISSKDIRWTNFVQLLEEKYDVSIAAYHEFSGQLAHIFAGSLLVTTDASIIGYNDSNFQAKGRRRFTIVHEGVHFICDAQKGTISQSFSDLLKNKNYSKTELQEEDNANFVASILMCNDSALIDSMKSGDNIWEFCDKFGFTPAAAWTRIYNYLHYSFGIPNERASILANAYKSGKDQERQTFVNILISNQDSFWKYMDIQTTFSNLAFNDLSNKWHDVTTTSSHFYQFQYLVDDLYKENGKLCTRCGTTYFGNKNFCQNCGHSLIDYDLISKGDVIVSDEIQLNDNNICTTCPNCGIENMHNTQICQYCGAYLSNICTGVSPTQFVQLVLNNPSRWTDSEDWIHEFGYLESYKNIIPGKLILDNVLLNADLPFGSYPHQSINFLPNYARFCDECGCVSSFYLQHFLPDVNVRTGTDPFSI